MKRFSRYFVHKVPYNANVSQSKVEKYIGTSYMYLLHMFLNEELWKFINYIYSYDVFGTSYYILHVFLNLLAI